MTLFKIETGIPFPDSYDPCFVQTAFVFQIVPYHLLTDCVSLFVDRLCLIICCWPIVSSHLLTDCALSFVDRLCLSFVDQSCLMICWPTVYCRLLTDCVLSFIDLLCLVICWLIVSRPNVSCHYLFLLGVISSTVVCVMSVESVKLYLIVISS